MLKKALLLVCAAIACVVAASADIPIPPCNPCMVSTSSAR